MPGNHRTDAQAAGADGPPVASRAGRSNLDCPVVVEASRNLDVVRGDAAMTWLRRQAWLLAKGWERRTAAAYDRAVHRAWLRRETRKKKAKAKGRK